MTTPTDLSPTAICRDSQAQIRVTIDPETVAFYKLLIEQADGEWPFTDPVVAFYDGETHWLADGFQRDLAWCDVFAEKGIPLPAYPVLVKEGTLRDAIRYATHEANRHGRPYTKQDRRNLAQRLIADQEWTQYSNRQIARLAGLDEKTIRNMRKALAAVETAVPAPTAGTAPAPQEGAAATPDAAALPPATLAPSGAENPHLDQMVMFDATAPGLEPRKQPLLPDCYAPEEPHQVIHLGTPLGCSIIDTHELTLCDRPAILAFAWRVEDERQGSMWSLRPVCDECVKLAD